MGKGSAPRPFTDRTVFDENFDKIFGKKKKVDYEYELHPSTGNVEKRFKDGISKPNGEQFGED
jgi:hypothetical protein